MAISTRRIQSATMTSQDRQRPSAPAGRVAPPPSAEPPLVSGRAFTRPKRRRMLGPLSLLLTAAGLLLLAALALTAVAAGNGVLAVDLSLTRWVQVHDGPFGATLVTVGEAFGSTRLLLGLACLVALMSAIRRRWSDVALVLAAGLSQYLGLFLKAVADSPRPASDMIRITAGSGLARPSAGHWSRSLFWRCCSSAMNGSLLTRTGRRTFLVAPSGVAPCCCSSSRATVAFRPQGSPQLA